MPGKEQERKPIICDYCGREMVFSKEVLIPPRSAYIYLKYICPRRKGEPGCGAVKKVRFKREKGIFP